MFDWSTRLHQIQVDVTTYCNASCGACIRNVRGGETKASLPMVHLDIDLWEKFIIRDLADRFITKITFNGNFGDVMMHPHLVRIVDTWIEHHPESFINLATNGSLRSKNFWHALGESLGNSKVQHRLEVAVDGLADTHNIYRRGTDFNKVVENMKTFIDAGGYCQPIVTVFDHNKHQIDDIVDLLKSIGCQAVEVRPSHSNKITIDTPNEKYTITAPDVDRKDYMWTESVSNCYTTERIEIEESRDLNTPCPWYNQAEVQIDPWGHVWPCCHISTYTIALDEDGEPGKEYTTVGEEFKKFNHLADNTLWDILSHNMFVKEIERTIAGKPWMVCQKSCGVGQGG